MGGRRPIVDLDPDAAVATLGAALYRRGDGDAAAGHEALSVELDPADPRHRNPRRALGPRRGRPRTRAITPSDRFGIFRHGL